MIKVEFSISTQVLSLPAPAGYFHQVVDLNDDGYDDIIFAGNIYPPQPYSLGAQPGYFLINDTKGGFIVAGGDHPFSYHPRNAVVADFDGDGRKDIFLIDHGYDADPFPGYTNHLFLNAGGNRYIDATARLPQFWDFSHSVAAADIDGNGTVDIYVGNIYGQNLIDSYFLLNDGSGHFTLDRSRLPDSLSSSVSRMDGRQSLAAEFVDLNGDGRPDLVVGAYEGAGISSVFFNNGAGDFSDGSRLDLPKNEQGGGAFTLVQDIKAGDLNKDGLTDLVLLSTTPDYIGWSVQVLMGQAGGGFIDQTAARIGPNHFNLNDSWTTFLTLQDASRTGALDIVLHGGGVVDNAPAILFNNGQGYFSALSEKGLASLSPFFAAWTDMTLNTPEGLQFVRVTEQNGQLHIDSVREIVASSEDWTRIGTPGNDVLLGASGDDKIFGQAGDDLFRGSTGDDILNGGLGHDTVAYGGGRSGFTVKLAGDGTISVIKGAGADRLISIERIEFTDGALIYDLDSANVPAAYRLYGGAFDRTPDEGGLLFWADYLDKGGTLFQAAAGFVASPEFIALYGADLSDADFVDQLYLNVLSRAGDADGVAFWNDYLATGGDRAAALVDFTQLPEYVGLSQADIANGYWVMPS